MTLQQFTDQMGRIVEFNHPPRRIISLVPSQTELLFELGLNEEVVGITKFCIHPTDKFKITDKVGGTKAINFEKIRALKPDLIIGNKEENLQEQIEQLMKEFPVWMSDIHTLDDAVEMITAVGQLVEKEIEATTLTTKIKNEFLTCTNLFGPVGSKSPLSVAYFIWKDPYMVAASNTFIDHILSLIGLENIFSEKERYPEVTFEDLKKASPDLVFLSSEPYPFKDKHVNEIQKMLPEAQVLLVDGEMFSWYGSRLQYASNYFQKISFFS
ncbi:ABC transporter substrate-binding protein [Solitalea lacus]|uniref:ABC transporter substrate-binding protein n=1 Tax=Solitalea lacus TaxID=2911172 RepID=UPI001EDAAA66|nr:helical backbone metal receptor [Solitalea lacus]UKJ09062.1 helical backbone metal receptor [Solitalea lacus]